MMKHSFLALAVLLPAWNAAAAGNGEGYRIRVGAGAQLRPEYIGADGTELAPLWDIDIARGTNEFGFEGPGDSFGIPLISSGGFSIGPAANIESSRTEEEVGAPVGKVKTTLEAGAFVQYLAKGGFRLRGELLQGLGGHDGTVGEIAADKIWRDGDNYVFSIGPRLQFSSGKYQQAYFGVTPGVALATGLPVYDPDGGIHAWGLASGLSVQFTPRIGMFGFARYDRLVGDAADSPIVRTYGSRSQASGGIGLNYTFNVGR